MNQRARSAPRSSALLEREEELEALGSALDAARAASGRLLVFEGHAGLGKSQLIEAASGFARGTGMSVMAAAGSELEREFPFGLALQLFEPTVAAADGRERERLLSGSAALAAPLLERSVPGSRRQGDEQDVFPLLHGLYWLVANAAERGPVLLAVDDAHWADQPTMRFLLYLAQRLGGLRVAVVLTRRTEEQEELLDKLAAHRDANTRVLQPLSEQAVDRLVRGAFDDPDVSFSRACAEVTGGNPLLVTQLLAALHREGAAPDGEGERRVRELGPETVSRSVLVRLGSLQLGTTALARAVSVLGDGTPLRRAAALAALEPGVATEAADALAAAEILKPGEPLAFVHPIVRQAIYAELPAAERARLHSRAAGLLLSEEVPPEQVATHLLAGEPGGQGWVVEVLRTAAERAMTRGAPTTAVRYLERALAEPPGREERPAVLVAAGRAAAATGDRRAVDFLEQAMTAVREPERRAEILLAMGRTLNVAGRNREAAETFDRGLRELGGVESELALRLEAGYVGAARMDIATLPLAVARMRPILARRYTGASAAERLLLAHVAYERALAGRSAAQTRSLATAALGDGKLLAEEGSDGTALYLAVAALAWCDDLDGADAAIAGALEDARQRGSVLGFAAAGHARARVRYLAGRVADAMADAHSALDAAGGSWRLGLPAAHAALSRALLERGELDAAEEALALPGGEERWKASVALSELFEARGWLALARSEPTEALEAFEECRRRQAWVQAPNPAIMGWRSGAALAAAALGEGERAHRLAGQELELARSFGAPRPVGAALRTAGLLEGGEEGLELLAESVRTLERSPAELELARSRTELGAALRRAGRRQASQEELRVALDLADRCGAMALAARARDELSRAGARPRRPRISGLDALTASERRVAELAADGMTNREIAQALFVTVKTVEWHLRNTYMKLGIGGRRELAKAMEAEAQAA